MLELYLVSKARSCTLLGSYRLWAVSLSVCGVAVIVGEFSISACSPWLDVNVGTSSTLSNSGKFSMLTGGGGGCWLGCCALRLADRRFASRRELLGGMAGGLSIRDSCRWSVCGLWPGFGLADRLLPFEASSTARSESFARSEESSASGCENSTSVEEQLES